MIFGETPSVSEIKINGNTKFQNSSWNSNSKDYELLSGQTLTIIVGDEQAGVKVNIKGNHAPKKAPTTCAELEEAGTLVIEGQTVFCDSTGKMWTPIINEWIMWNTNLETTKSLALAKCQGYADFTDGKIPNLTEHKTFRSSIGVEFCPITSGGYCIATPNWEPNNSYTDNPTSYFVLIDGPGKFYRIWNDTLYSTVTSGKVRCIRG